MGQIFLKMLVGGAGGLLAWAIWEPTMPTSVHDPRWGIAGLRLILTVGALVGLSLGAANGYFQGSKLHATRGALFGLIGGIIGASIGIGVSGVLMKAFPTGIFISDYPIFQVIPARIVALTPIGLCLGTAIGAAGLTKRRIMVGALGGLCGGLLAGVLFDLVSAMLAPVVASMQAQRTDGLPQQTEVGIFGRALTTLLIGGGIGLFMGVWDRFTRTAWLRLSLGRNEGKEWVVDAPQTFLGRNESAHVPLFGDPSIAPMHACIVRQNDGYVLMDGGSPVGTYVNGQSVKQMPLFHGAMIRIGTYNLEFLMKVGSAPQRAAEALRAQFAHPQQPVAVPVQPVGVQVFPQPAYNLSTPNPVAMAAVSSALVGVSGPLAGQRFSVVGTLELGREASGIGLGFDSSASRRHAMVSPAANGLQITDLNSTNGTFVNDQRVQSTTIRPGDVVRIGVSSFRVE